MLTDIKVKSTKPKEKAFKLSDSGGLYLHVKPNGGKYWRLKYRFLGSEKLLSIGVYPDVSLAKARKARDAAKELLSEGIDPSLHKQVKRHQQQDSLKNTFEAVAWEWHSKQSIRWAASTAEKQKALLTNDILPYMGKRPVADIETFELVGCLNRIVERGTVETAHKCRQIVNQVCRYAKQTGRTKHNPAADLAGALPPRRVTHMAAITDPLAYGRLLVDIDAYEGTHIVRTALKLAPLLFQRPGELCAMEWAELDMEVGNWTIPREKKKERNQIEGDHVVPLSRQAIELLQDIAPLTGHMTHVFPNQRTRANPIRTESLSKAIKQLRNSHPQTIHGFRASARTMLDEQLQLRIEWIEQQLAHKVRDTLGNAYNRTKHLPERAEMMQRWADYLDDLKRQVLVGNVVTAEFKR